MSLPRVYCGDRVFTGELGKVFENGCIVVDHDKIISVGSEGSIDYPGEVEPVWLGGYTIVPGLIDAHIHITGFRSGDYVKESLLTPFGVFIARGIVDIGRILDAGFTTIVDAGSVVGLHLRDAVNEGVVKGPRIVASGYPISQTFGHGDIHFLPIELADTRSSKLLSPFMSLLCDGADECRKAARFALRNGVDFIKIFTTGGVASQRDRPEYPQFTLEEIKAIVEEARRANRFVHTHAEGAEGIINALEAGITRIAHGIYVDQDGINLALERNAVVIPTLSVVDLILKLDEASGLPSWALEKAREAHDTHISNIRKAYRQGVRLAAGTDFFVNSKDYNIYGMNGLELQLLVEKIGLSPMEAIIAATSNSAYIAGLQDRVGLLKPGYTADFIAVKGNPLNNISLIVGMENIGLVVKEGAVVKNVISK
ncbi:MAG: amidohydrolase family protein [Desulfurococcales archaeon]|nr:amidohydrolase family protein [Desulfurococcales archaeon]